jgi:hypothetical protein
MVGAAFVARAAAYKSNEERVVGSDPEGARALTFVDGERTAYYKPSKTTRIFNTVYPPGVQRLSERPSSLRADFAERAAGTWHKQGSKASPPDVVQVQCGLARAWVLGHDAGLASTLEALAEDWSDAQAHLEEANNRANEAVSLR